MRKSYRFKLPVEIETQTMCKDIDYLVLEYDILSTAIFNTYDLEEIKKHLETGLETLKENPDYDDLVGYIEECIKETNRLIDDNKEELNELLEEPNLYDEYNERMREYREQQGF